MIKTKRRFRFKYLYFGIGILGMILLAAGLFGYFAFYQPYLRIKTKGEVLIATANTIKDDFKKNDIDLIKGKMSKLEREFQEFETEASSVYWASFVPQIADLRTAVEAGKYIIEAGKQSVDAIYPYADLIGFKKGESSFVEKSAEERLQTAVLTLDKVLQNVDKISDNIDKAQQKIAAIDPQRYPERVGDTEVRAKIVQVKESFDAAATFFVRAKPLIKQLPTMLGKDGEITYLILFQNEHERRATGGFLTAYAVMKIKDGKIELENSTNIYDLDSAIPDSKRPPLPDKIKAYHVNVPRFWIRDSNLSPDFAESVKLFESLYQHSSTRKEYDAIVTIDTHVLVDLLEIFGDTEAGGVTFSSRMDPRCDCPQAIYEIFDNVGRPVGYIRENRKGILGQLMYALFFKAIGFSPSKYWGPMAERMIENLDQKHILLHFKDPEIQKAVEQMNYGGRIAQTEGDYLHINNVNFAGAKSNLFVTEDIESETIFADGGVKRKVRVIFKNPYKHSDCNLERSSLCLNATLRNWIRFYVPEGAKLVSFKGSKTKVLTYDELGKTVYEGFMEVKPEGRAEVVVEYTLPPVISKDNYSLLMQKQPGVSKQTLSVKVDGRTRYTGPFDIDREFR